MRNHWLERIEKELREGRKDIIIISADLGFGVYENFENEFPENFINCGVSEQNMIGIATGLALTGKKVFCYSIGNFSTLRCLEQIRNDVCYHNLDVTIVCVGAGFGYGQLGMSHHATEDLSIMRSIPNLNTYVPYDDPSTIIVTERILGSKKPNYLRLERGSQVLSGIASQTQYNGIISTAKADSDITIFTIGGISIVALGLLEKLSEIGIHATINLVQSFQDLDKHYLNEVLKKNNTVICVEENIKEGGLGSWLLENASKIGTNISLLHFGIEGFISVVGDQEYLRKYCSLDTDSIFEKIKETYL